MTNSPDIKLHQGKTSLLVSVPHSGIGLPADLLDQITAEARQLPDTDWFVDRLYNWVTELNVSFIVAPWSRYVVDLNRPPDDGPLYDQKTSKLLTGLVPINTFSGQAIYQLGREPRRSEIQRRLERYWKPYHHALRDELGRIKKRHGHAVLFDAHSIRQEQPLLFDGKLPDLNLGSNGGQSAATGLIARARDAMLSSQYSLVVDGRFKGGYITRQYGNPAENVHALQLEMAQSVYMQEDPPCFREDQANNIRPTLRKLIEILMNWKPDAN